MADIVEVSTYTAVVPAISDGEPANGAEFTAPLQALANRTKYFKDLLTDGIQKIQVLADAASLRAVTTHANGSAAAVADVGLFYFAAASTATDDGVLVIKPTDVGGGAGRWLNPAYHLLARANTWSATQTCATVYATGLYTTGGGTIASDGDLTAVGDGAIGGALVVGGICTLVGVVGCTTDLNVGGDLDVTGGIHAGGASLFSSTCHVVGATTCSSTLTVGGALTVTGLSTLGGGVAINGASTLTKRLASSSTGRVGVRVVAGADTPTTYGIDDADTIIVTALSGDTTYTLSETNAVNGDVIKFATEDATHTVTINNADGVGAALIAGTWNMVEYTYMSGVWRITDGFKP
jgi:plastocyanin